MLEPTPDYDIVTVIGKALTGPLSFIWFAVIALLGGTVNYISRIKRGEVKGFSVAELLGEWIISGFTALLTAYLCIIADFDWYTTAFACGISGHLGARAIFVFEQLFNKWINRYIDTKDKD